MPSRMRESATPAAQNSRTPVRPGSNAETAVATAKAVIECPEGNENRSGGMRSAQQWGSMWHGRVRPTALFRITNIAYYRSIAKRIGADVAVFATARKLATLIAPWR